MLAAFPGGSCFVTLQLAASNHQVVMLVAHRARSSFTGSSFLRRLQEENACQQDTCGRVPGAAGWGHGRPARKHTSPFSCFGFAGWESGRPASRVTCPFSISDSWMRGGAIHKSSGQWRLPGLMPEQRKLPLRLPLQQLRHRKFLSPCISQRRAVDLRRCPLHDHMHAGSIICQTVDE